MAAIFKTEADNQFIAGLMKRFGLKDKMKGSTDMSVLVVSHEELASALRIRSAGALPGQTMQKSKFTSKSFCIPSYKEDPESLKASAEGFSDPELREALLQRINDNINNKDGITICVVGANTGAGLKSLSATSTDKMQIVQQHLSKMPFWSEFDVNELAHALNGRPLAAVSKAALKKLGLMGNLDPLRLHCFLVDLESRYHQNEYHCSTHAADVVQGVFVFIVEGGLAHRFEKWELLALVLAAAGHDVGHKGYSNKFLLEFKDPIVAEYGDVSPNETMHAKITTSLIKQYGLLPSHLSEPVCSAVTDTIVFTDMARHSELVRQFDGFVKQYGADVSCWPAGKARTCCMRMILHMADIGNVAKPTSMAIPWAKGMSKEQQHEQHERVLRESGPEVAALSENEQVNMPASQLSFITGSMFKIRDAFTSLSAITPPFGPQVVELLDGNVRFYSTLVDQGVTTL